MQFYICPKIKSLYKKIQDGWKRLKAFDLNDKKNRILILIVLVNCIVMFIACSLSLFGWIIAFFYSIALLVFLHKYYQKIHQDYSQLLNATKQLSEGNFDMKINEDLGAFNSLGQSFTSIKDGFEKAVHEEVKSQRMKTELISNVSHDLKTPLTSIITYVDLLKNENLCEEERKKYIDTLDRNSLRLKTLIEDLFEVSKATSGNIHLNIVNVDIVSLISQAQFECMDKIQEMNLDFKTHFSQDKIICPLDSSKTYRIFENLLTNICKYALPHTRVYIDVKEMNEEVMITFKNISANEIDFDVDEIVERFVQGDKSRNANGSGLGLAIAKSFTELQGGSFKIEVDGDLFKAIVIFKKKPSSN